MDTLYQHVNPVNATFYMRHAVLPHFVVPWHYHSEFELMYVIKGEGTRVVGDSVQNFNSGDFVFIGSGIPHLWRSDERYYKNLGLEVECLLLFFNEEVFGANFLAIPEMSKIKKMLSVAKRGIYFPGKESDKLKNLMIKGYEQRGMDRMLTVISILHEMTEFKESDVLCSAGYCPDVNHRDRHRLDECLQYITENFKDDIKLNDMAEMANMTTNSFCRYFKRRTTMAFLQFLTELRVRNASQLLIESEMKIIEIAYDSGFRSLSNFNGHFRKLRRMSPREYRKKVRKGNLV